MESKNDIEINEEKLELIKKRIFRNERYNYVTGKESDKQMVDKIIKIIMDEVQNEN